MYKHSASRNQRSRGVKVKHVLQICLLVAVCFWLIYQVKHSHDKKKEFDEQDDKISLNTDKNIDVAKLGRKDLHPRVEETSLKDEKYVEEVEEENTGEDEQEDNKTEEKDDDGRDGVEELDDRDQEKSDAENDQEEEFIDDEKEREVIDEQEGEVKDPEDNNGKTENDGALQDTDREGGARNTHEAREENYKADDASSAVAHDIQVTTADNETVIVEKSNGQAGMSGLENHNASNDTEEITAGQNTLLNDQDGEISKNNSYLVPIANAENENISSNSNITENSSDQAETTNNSTELRRESSDLSLQNGNETTHEMTQAQSIVERVQSGRVDTNLETTLPRADDNSTFSNRNNELDSYSTNLANVKDSDSNLEMRKLSGDNSSISEIKSGESARSEVDSGSLEMENNEETQDVKDDATGGIEEGSDELNSEVPHDPIDSSDSSVSLEEKYVRTDLDTLPEIQTEGSNSEETAAE